MALNVDRYRDAIVGAWKQVMDEKDPTNWALFGYDGQSYDLNLVSKGDGGLEELAEDLNSGQIMYALCRVKLKEKNVEKVILVNWQGEGAPLARKGTCANHIGTVKNFFKGVNVTINARTEEDVDADVILQTVAKAVAGEGLAQTSSISEAPAPVGTVYKKVNPKDDINSAAKDEFWKKEEQEEERRKRDEQNRYRKFSQNEVKLLRRESQEYFNEAEKGPVFKTNGTNGNSSYMSTAEAVKASMPKRDSTSGDLVRQRIKSFDHGASPSSNGGQSPSNGVGDNTKNNATVSESVSVLKRRQMFEGGSMNSTTSAPVHRRNPAQEIKEAQDSAKKTSSNEIQQPPVTKTQTPKTQPAMESRPAEIKSYTPAIVPDTVKSISPTPTPTVVETKPVHHYDEPARDEPLNGNYEHEDVNGGTHVQESGKFPDLVAEADRQEMTSPVVEINSDMGTCARALYDYQAADDSEITFDPGEIITNIEKIDEGWWEGMGPRGVYGLFPANYVELLN